ncbi:hypothetical protein CsSME_00050659 [Camellia sinensis var. sinensis]
MNRYGVLSHSFSLFSQRQSLLKFAPMQCTKGEKASYCLACLISLVEQARYLQFRNWPVEWGWCRDLQSFIFVFERHNRIVRERPEYGYATYFFEFLDFLPINWQIKHLVTAMKLPSCSRVTLIENKALLVRVRFIGFGSEEDEWVNVKKAIREHSLPLEHSKCGKLEVGDLIHFSRNI